MLKRSNPLVTGAVFVAVAVLVVGLAVAGSSAFLNKMPSANQTCASEHPSVHKVILKNGVARPGHTTAKLCDTLSITNMDESDKLVAFGPQEDHLAYNGVAERLLSKNQSFSIALNQAGSYRFHDHIHDDSVGYFTVTK